MVAILSPGAVLAIGLGLVGFDLRRQGSVRRAKNVQRFLSHFGAAPAVHAAVWTDMQTADSDESRVGAEAGDKVEHLLMAAHFLKCYPKGNQSEATLKLCDKTIQKWVNAYLKKLQGSKSQKILWPASWRSKFTLAVDGVHCRVFEPSHGRCSKNPACCSHKFKQAALDYEIALSIFDNQRVWVNGPFPAGKNDMSVFRARNGLKEKMVATNSGFGIADLGCRGEPELLRTPNSHDVPLVRELKSRALARHEKFNGQLKNFSCLSETFRHGLEMHQVCFDSVVVICQCELENGSPLNVV